MLWRDVAGELWIIFTLIRYISSRRVDTTSLKGPTYEAGTRLQAASGVHHLIGNLWHVLVSECLGSLETV